MSVMLATHDQSRLPKLIVVCGVTGSGKTTVGQALAARLGRIFVDADAFHSQANVEKMKRGEPLDEADRAPWLSALQAKLESLASEPGEGAVLACSALRLAYRQILRGPLGDSVGFVLLRIDEGSVVERVMRRNGHFAGPNLIASQLQLLEPLGEGDEPCLTVNVGLGSVDSIVDEIANRASWIRSSAAL